MSDQTFPVSLGGKNWALPHLPFRVIKSIQPVFMRLSQKFGADAQRALASLGEIELDEFAGAVHKALAEVDPSLTREAFFNLPFSLGELTATIPSVCSACGLKVVVPGEEGGEAPGK